MPRSGQSQLSLIPSCADPVMGDVQANLSRSFEIRLTTSEVCAIGRFSHVTLWRRIKSGQMPSPIDRGRQSIFDRDAVIAALRPTGPMSDDAKTGNGDWVTEALDARRAFLAVRKFPK